jgi:hypothetical protein
MTWRLSWAVDLGSTKGVRAVLLQILGWIWTRQNRFSHSRLLLHFLCPGDCSVFSPIFASRFFAMTVKGLVVYKVKIKFGYEFVLTMFVPID